jgi:hypothetical protein
MGGRDAESFSGFRGSYNAVYTRGSRSHLTNRDADALSDRLGRSPGKSVGFDLRQSRTLVRRVSVCCEASSSVAVTRTRYSPGASQTSVIGEACGPAAKTNVSV